MSNKETNLKEKFRIALSSTAKVIADDIDINNKSSEDKKTKDISSFEINDLTSPSDFIKLRAETDSSALKKRFSDEKIYRKNLPTNTSSRSLYNIAEKIRYEALGGKMLKGIQKNFSENYSQIINRKRKDQLKTKEDVPVAEAFELYMLKNFHNIDLNPLTSRMLNFWEKDFEQSIKQHKDFLLNNLENQNTYSLKFSEILEEMDIFQSDEEDREEERRRALDERDLEVPDERVAPGDVDPPQRVEQLCVLLVEVVRHQRDDAPRRQQRQPEAGHHLHALQLDAADLGRASHPHLVEDRLPPVAR